MATSQLAAPAGVFVDTGQRGPIADKPADITDQCSNGEGTKIPDMAVSKWRYLAVIGDSVQSRSKVRAPIRRPALPVALAVVSSAVVLAACGSSGKPGGGSGSAAASGAIRYADCMRAHGVQKFPDPGSADGGVQLSGSGINTQSPAFVSGQSACQKLLHGGLPGRGGGSATRIAQGVRIAACIRAHGLRSFPDPTTSPPSAPPAPDETILGGPYGVFSLSGSMFESPAFKRAAATCRFPLPGRGFTMPVAVPGG
jgi:hypothetical protein